MITENPTTKEEYLQAKIIVEKYEREQNKKPERSFLSGDDVLIKEGDIYFVVVFSNPEMTIVKSIDEHVFPHGIEYCNENYRCFSTKKNAYKFVMKKEFVKKI